MEDENALNLSAEVKELNRSLLTANHKNRMLEGKLGYKSRQLEICEHELQKQFAEPSYASVISAHDKDFAMFKERHKMLEERYKLLEERHELFKELYNIQESRIAGVAREREQAMFNGGGGNRCFVYVIILPANVFSSVEYDAAPLAEQ